MSWGLSSNKLTALKNDKSKVRSAKSYCGKAESNSVDTDTRKSSAKNVLTDAVMAELIFDIEEQIEEEKERLRREREAERKAKESSS